MDDKTRKAIETAIDDRDVHPLRMSADSIFEDGAIWMHAHDAEKLRLAEFVMGFILQGYIVTKELDDIAQRIIAEAKGDTDG